LRSFNSVRILDCYSDLLRWKENIQIKQHQEGNIKQFSTIKKNINVFRSVNDLKMLMHSTIELEGGIIQHRAFFFCSLSLHYLSMLTFLWSFYAYVFMLLMSEFEGEGQRYFSIAIDSVRTKYFPWCSFVGCKQYMGLRFCRATLLCIKLVSYEDNCRSVEDVFLPSLFSYLWNYLDMAKEGQLRISGARDKIK
jgi:hypothetical protein